MLGWGKQKLVPDVEFEITEFEITVVNDWKIQVNPRENCGCKCKIIVSSK